MRKKEVLKTCHNLWQESTGLFRAMKALFLKKKNITSGIVCKTKFKYGFYNKKLLFQPISISKVASKRSCLAMQQN